MISFGDKVPGKFYFGENPLAKALGRCMFDNVYVFVEEPLIVFWRLRRRRKRFREESRRSSRKARDGTQRSCISR